MKIFRPLPVTVTYDNLSSSIIHKLMSWKEIRKNWYINSASRTIDTDTNFSLAIDLY